MSKQTALITGASGGIGLELARLFAAGGQDVVLVARSEDKLRVLAAELEQRHGATVHVISEDLSEPAAPQRVFDAALDAGVQVDALVNNAGFGLYGAFVETPIERELEMIRLNVTALTHLCKLFLAPMAERGRGRVMNVASTAAFAPGPLMSVYYATKAYVLSFSEALANEMKGTGVTVTAFCPGPTRTGFANAAATGDTRLMHSPGVMDAAPVARLGFDAMMSGKTVAIPGVQNKLLAESVRLMPRALVRGVTRRIMEGRTR